MKEIAENLTEFVEDTIIPILAQRGFNSKAEILEGKWEVGEAIVKSPFWKHGSKAELYESVGELVGLETRSVQYMVEFYQKYQNAQSVDKLVGCIDEDGKMPSWRDIVKSLPSGSVKDATPLHKCQHEGTCAKCGEYVKLK